MSPPSSTDSLRAGALVAGKYRLGAPLGQGGMGLVFAAAHETLGTPLALKVLRPEAVLSPGMIGRFLQEARAAALLQSEHVAKVHDFGTLPDGSPYLAMEYLHGRDLQYVLDRRSKLPVQQAVEIMRQTCDALSEAHAAGIVHRDLKPHNLFLLTRPNNVVFVKVLDFGIAKMLGSERFRVDVSTQSTALLGTPLYMAPEQLRAAKTADARADIWSLGVILFQMLSGKMPFQADSLAELSVKVLTGEAPRLPDSLALPEALVDIVQRCLQRDPADRFASVDELAMVLDPFVTTRRVSIPDFSSPSMDPIQTGPRSALDSQANGMIAATLPATDPNAWPTNTGTPVSVDAHVAAQSTPGPLAAPAGAGRKRVATAVGLIGVAFGGGVAFLWMARHEPPQAAATPPPAIVQPVAAASSAVLPSQPPSAAASDWTPVPSISANANPVGANGPRHRPDPGPKSSAGGQAVSAPPPPAASNPKLGNNGAPILEN